MILSLAALDLAAPLAAQPPPHLPIIDSIVVHKAARTMELYAGGQVVWTIPGIQFGREPAGPKHFRGDLRTPEGHYVIAGANPVSFYHLALRISYPSPADVAYARTQGRDPGGGVFIHGQPEDWALARGRVPGDWTDGCIALSNAEIEALWDAVPDGTPIDIQP